MINGSQFFIVMDAAPDLNGNYSILGEVTQGMDRLEAIADRRRTDREYSDHRRVISPEKQPSRYSTATLFQFILSSLAVLLSVGCAFCLGIVAFLQIIIRKESLTSISDVISLLFIVLAFGLMCLPSAVFSGLRMRKSEPVLLSIQDLLPGTLLGLDLVDQPGCWKVFTGRNHSPGFRFSDSTYSGCPGTYLMDPLVYLAWDGPIPYATPIRVVQLIHGRGTRHQFIF